jgi:hypothetical protein
MKMRISDLLSSAISRVTCMLDETADLDGASSRWHALIELILTVLARFCINCRSQFGLTKWPSTIQILSSTLVLDTAMNLSRKTRNSHVPQCPEGSFVRSAYFVELRIQPLTQRARRSK